MQPSVDHTRFTRHDGLWSPEDQRRLGAGCVAVGGLGGVGAPVALMLAKAGVGHVTIADRDFYGVENVVEQAFACHDSIGMLKVDAASAEMRRHCPDMEVTAFTMDLSQQENAVRLASSADLVFSGVDNPEARIALGRACALQGKPFVVSANVGWGVFHTIYLPGENSYAASYRHITGLKLCPAGLPDMTDPQTARIVRRDWRIWGVLLSKYRPGPMREFVERELDFYWYAAAPAFHAASLAVADGIKLLLHRGRPVCYPDIVVFDMLTMGPVERDLLAYRYLMLNQCWEDGTDAVLSLVDTWQREDGLPWT